jgi:hypothetical protein
MESGSHGLERITALARLAVTIVKLCAILRYIEIVLTHHLVPILLASTSIAHARVAPDHPIRLLQQQPQRALPPRGLAKGVLLYGLRHSVLMIGAAMGSPILRGASAAVVDPASSADGPLLACDKGWTWIFPALACSYGAG